LLCHACETLASLNVLITDLACDLQSSKRLLVNQALDNIDPQQ